MLTLTRTRWSKLASTPGRLEPLSLGLAMQGIGAVVTPTRGSVDGGELGDFSGAGPPGAGVERDDGVDGSPGGGEVVDRCQPRGRAGTHCESPPRHPDEVRAEAEADGAAAVMLGVAPAGGCHTGGHEALAVAAEAHPGAGDVDERPGRRRSRVRQAGLMVALFSALFLASLNAKLTATAVPTICAELHSAAGYAWVGGAFLLGNAACGPIWAKLSDIWGRKAIVLSAVAGFAASSVVCALAGDMATLIAGRALQGVAAGGLAQLVSIIISDLFSMRHRSLYIGLLEIIWALAGGVGPVLGGSLAQSASWRFIFWLLLPPCALSFVLLLLLLDVHNPRTGLVEGLRAVDWAGSAAMLGLLVMLLLGLDLGGVDAPWTSPTVLCLLLFGALAGLLFCLCERRLARHPLLPLAIFARRSNAAVLAVAFAHDFALFSAQYYLPFFLQSAQARSPIASGLLQLPLAVSTSLSGLLAGCYVHRTGRYVELLWLGQGIVVAGLAAMTRLAPGTSLAQLCGVQLLTAVGMGMLFTPPLIALQSSVPQSQTATATAAMTFVRNVATVLAVVAGQAMFQAAMARRQPDLAAAGLSGPLRAAFAPDQAAANVGRISRIADSAQRLAVESAFAASLRGVWILDACLVGLGFFATAFVVENKLSKEHDETKTGLQPESLQLPPPPPPPLSRPQSLSDQGRSTPEE